MPAQQSRGSVATTRLRKASCDSCGYMIRVSRKWLAVGLPTCPCGQPMVSDDEWAETEAELRQERELAEWQEHDFRAAEREARKGRGGLSYEERATCEWCGGFVAHRGADCRKCGHIPDLAIGHRNIPNRRKRQPAAMPF